MHEYAQTVFGSYICGKMRYSQDPPIQGPISSHHKIRFDGIFLSRQKLGFGTIEDVPLVEFMYIYLYACQVRVTVGDSGLCCCVCVTSCAMIWDYRANDR